jgi:TolB-like protein
MADLAGRLRRLLDELRRRHVVRVAFVYVVIAWVLVQAADTTFPHLSLPPWTITFVIVMTIVGFPVALMLAWALELTPEGIRRAPPPTEGLPPGRGTVPLRPFAWGAVGVLLVVLGAWLLAVRSASTEATEHIRAVAVLPFDDISPLGDQAHLGHGLAEEILNALAKIDGLRVPSRTSTIRLAETGVDIPALGDRLQVDAILEGTVRKQGDSLRITAQLIRVRDDSHIWSEQFDGSSGDVFAIQEAIARAVVGVVGASLPAEGRQHLVDRQTSNPEAYDLYLRGRLLWARLTADSYPPAAEYFQRAIDLDPTFARALAALGETYVYLAHFGSPPVEDWEERARSLVSQALSLDPTLGEAYASLAVLHYYVDDDVRAAETASRTAAALDPRYPFPITWVARNLMHTHGNMPEAVAWAARAYELDPFTFMPISNYAEALLWSGEVDRAVQVAQRNTQFNGEVPYSHITLAHAYSALGLSEDAVASAEEAARMALRDPEGRVFWTPGRDVVCRAAQVLGATGERERARALLAQAHELDAPAFCLGLAHGLLGDSDRAFELMRLGGWRYPDRALLEFDPLYAPLRTDSRWPSLLQQMKRDLDVD